MLKTLNDWDVQSFLWLNNLGSDAYDGWWMWVTNWGFVPLVAVMLVFIFKAYGLKNTLIAIVYCGLIIVVADQVCGNFIRDLNIRLRPCHMPELAGQFRSVREQMTGDCGGQYGFVSAHSGNAFALAVFLTMILRGKLRWVGVATIIWAGAIAYSRVYLGVHFTGDVLVGGMIGALIGVIGGWIFVGAARK